MNLLQHFDRLQRNRFRCKRNLPEWTEINGCKLNIQIRLRVQPVFVFCCGMEDSPQPSRSRASDRATNPLHDDANVENEELSTSEQQDAYSELDHNPQDVASKMLVQIAPWMEEERSLLPHQEAAILMEFARDGNIPFI